MVAEVDLHSPFFTPTFVWNSLRTLGISTNEFLSSEVIIKAYQSKLEKLNSNTEKDKLNDAKELLLVFCEYGISRSLPTKKKRE